MEDITTMQEFYLEYLRTAGSGIGFIGRTSTHKAGATTTEHRIWYMYDTYYIALRASVIFGSTSASSVRMDLYETTEIEPIKLVKTFNFDYENGHAFKETIEYIQQFLKEFPKKRK